MDFHDIPAPEKAAQPTPEQQRDIEALKARCVTALRGYNPPAPVYVGADGIPHRLAQIVIEGLRTRGWDAEYQSDQRDGDYLALTPRNVTADHYAK